MGFASTFWIEELTAQKRRLILTGSGLPFKGAPWGSGLTQTTTWNPGNSVDATQQIIGGYLMPSQYSGAWRTTRLTLTPAQYFSGPGAKQEPVSRALTLFELAEAIFASGQRLRVTWMQETAFDVRRIVREGICDEFRVEADTADDLAWTMSFTWSGRGASKSPAVTPADRTAQSLKKANLQLAAYTSETEARDRIESRQGIPMSTDSFGLGDLEAIADIPKDFARQLKQFTTAINSKISGIAKLLTTLAATPTMAASTILEIATQGVQTLSQAADEMGRAMPDSISNVEGDAAALISAANYFAVEQDAAEGMAGVFAEMKLAAQRRRSNIQDPSQTGLGNGAGGIIAVELSRFNTTFAMLAMKYYGNPDLGYEIAKSNGFDEDMLAPPKIGTTLIIPALDGDRSLLGKF